MIRYHVYITFLSLRNNYVDYVPFIIFNFAPRKRSLCYDGVRTQLHECHFTIYRIYEYIMAHPRSRNF